MKLLYPFLKPIVTAFFFSVLFSPAKADEAALNDLFARLQTATPEAAQRIEREIWSEWSHSGSPAMDRLLQQGRLALAQRRFGAAIDSFSVVIENAPEFAEAWNSRATAFYMAGRFGLSVSDIAEVLRLNPRHFGAISGLGSIFEATGRDKEALQVYKEALKIHPHLRGIAEKVKALEDKLLGQEL